MRYPTAQPLGLNSFKPLRSDTINHPKANDKTLRTMRRPFPNKSQYFFSETLVNPNEPKMFLHLPSPQTIFTLLLPLIPYIPSAESATPQTKKSPPNLNATNTQFHCTNDRAWTTTRHVDVRAAHCKEAMEEFNREGDKQRARGASWGAPYWANPRAFLHPLEHPAQWTPVRFAVGAWQFLVARNERERERSCTTTTKLTDSAKIGSCVLSIVLMGQAGEIPEKPAPPYEDKVQASWAELYQQAELLWGECELLRTRVGWIRVRE